MKKILYQFSQLLLIFICVSIVYLIFPKKEDTQLSIWQGHTSLNRTSISVLTNKNKKYIYYLVQKKNNTPDISDVKKRGQKVFPIHQFFRDFSDWSVDHFILLELKPKKTYQFVVLDTQSQIMDYREFQTRNINKASLKIAVASCMDDHWNPKVQSQMWKDLMSFNTDLIFLIGDNVYADHGISSAKESEFWRRYVETFQTLELYKSRKLIPILAIWDDHDYGKSNGGKHFHLNKTMQQLFREFFFLDEDAHLKITSGVSFTLKTRYQNFFFMDDRSFRSDINNPDGSLWGIQQETNLLQSLNEDPKPAWIINGMQFFGDHHRFESYQRDFPHHFQKMMKKISQTPGAQFLVSGDRHIAQFMKSKVNNQSFYELTTSPIHAKIYPKPSTFKPHPRLIYTAFNHLNFAIINSKTRGKGLEVDFNIYTQKKQILFSKKILIIKE